VPGEAAGEDTLIEPEGLLPADTPPPYTGEVGPRESEDGEEAPEFDDPIDEQPAAPLDLGGLRADREVIERATKIQNENSALKRRLAAFEQRAAPAATAISRMDTPDLVEAKSRAAMGELALREERARIALEALQAPSRGGDPEVDALKREMAALREQQREADHRRDMERMAAEHRRDLQAMEGKWQAAVGRRSEVEEALALAQRVGWTPPGAHNQAAASQELLKDTLHGVRGRLDRWENLFPQVADRLDRPSPIQRALDAQAEQQALELVNSDPRFAAAIDQRALERAAEIARERGEAHALLDAEVPEGSPPAYGDPEELRRRLEAEAARVPEPYVAPSPPPRPRNDDTGELQ